MEIRPNDTLITVTIPIVNDAIDEGVEIFSVATSSMSEFLLIENPVAIVQIIDRNGKIYVRHEETDLLTISSHRRGRFESGMGVNQVHSVRERGERGNMSDSLFPSSRHTLFSCLH